jgi:hypothetical protein
MFAVERFLLEISQPTYPVASSTMNHSGRSSTIKAVASGERMAWRVLIVRKSMAVMISPRVLRSLGESLCAVHFAYGSFATEPSGSQRMPIVRYASDCVAKLSLRRPMNRDSVE